MSESQIANPVKQIIPTTQESTDIYERLRIRVRGIFSEILEKEKTIVSVFKASGIKSSNSKFMSLFPDHDKAHYNCHVCKDFLTRISDWGYIEDDNTIRLVFDEALRREGLNAEYDDAGGLTPRSCSFTPVTQLFDNVTIDEKGGFNHIHAFTLDEVKTYNGRHRSFDEFFVNSFSQLVRDPNVTAEAVESFSAIVRSKLYRPDTIGLLFPFIELLKQIKQQKEHGFTERTTVMMRSVRTDHDWMRGIKSSNAGNVLDGLRQGAVDEYQTEKLVNFINENTDPELYKKALVEAAAQALAATTKFLKESGFERLIERRAATMAELNSIWTQPSPVPEQVEDQTGMSALDKAVKQKMEQKKGPSILEKIAKTAENVNPAVVPISRTAFISKLSDFKSIKYIADGCAPVFFTTAVDETDYSEIIHTSIGQSALLARAPTRPVPVSRISYHGGDDIDVREIVAVVKTDHDMMFAIAHGVGRATYLQVGGDDNGTCFLGEDVNPKYKGHARAIAELSRLIPLQGKEELIGGYNICTNSVFMVTDAAGVRTLYRITSLD